MTKPPNPFEGAISRLVNAVKETTSSIRSTLGGLVGGLFRRKDTSAAIRESSKALVELNGELAQWTKENLTKAAELGAEQAWVAINFTSAKGTLNDANKAMLDVAIADTQADLLAVTQNVDRRVRSAVRQAVAEVFRDNLATGANGLRTNKRDILKRLRDVLGSAVDTGIIDAAGRRWRPEVYVDMVVRTKLAETQRQSTINEAVGRGVLYGQISRHGATDACRNWEGKIVKLVPDAPGPFPYIGDLPRKEIFHPCCRHVVTPIRNPPGLDA